MNACFAGAVHSAISPSPLISKRRPNLLPLSSYLSRPSSSSSSSSSLSPSLFLTSITPKPRTPLFLRSPTHLTPLADIQKFHTWATNLIFSCGSHFEATDNGPGTDLLRRELRWLLADAVEDSSVLTHFGSSQNPIFLRPMEFSEEFFPNARLDSSQDPSFVAPIADSEDFSVRCLLGSSQNPSFSESNPDSEEFLTNSCMGSSRNGRMIRLKAGLEELHCLWKERIENRRPFQYIVGCEHWRDMVLSVEEGVLIPRPETELIVDMVSHVVIDNPGLREGIWVDLGTGSGAIGIAIGRILGERGRVVATDVSDVAVAVSRSNVERYGLQDKVEIRQGSWFEPLQDLKGKLSGLVSNPPYIPSYQIPGLQAEVGRHEPIIALDGGQNGMDDLLHLCEGSVSALKHGGFVAFETNGDEQSKFIADFMRSKTDNSFHNVKIESDCAGVQRFVTGFRR